MTDVSMIGCGRMGSAMEEPSRAGALILYDSRSALRAYKDSDAYQRAVREIADNWAESAEPYDEEVYELLDV